MLERVLIPYMPNPMPKCLNYFSILRKEIMDVTE
jgi:hypothetical protein